MRCSPRYGAKGSYASVVAAVLEPAGEKAQTVAIAPPSPGSTEAWARPKTFTTAAPRASRISPGQPNPAFRAQPSTLFPGSRHDRLDRPFPVRPVPVHLPGRVLHPGSWVRFDRDQYTWKNDSSAAHLRTGSLRWASNLFHIGVLFCSSATSSACSPHALYEPFISAGNKQLLAMVSGGAAACSPSSA